MYKSLVCDLSLRKKEVFIKYVLKSPDLVTRSGLFDVCDKGTQSHWH